MRIIVVLLLALVFVTGAAIADSKYEYVYRQMTLEYEMVAKRTGSLDDLAVFKGTVYNNGDKEIRLVEVTVQFLDRFNNPFKEVRYYPVKYYKYVVGSAGAPLEAEYQIDFSYICRDCPIEWFHNFDAEITDIEFVKSGFAVEHLYNPFLVLYKKIQSIKD